MDHQAFTKFATAFQDEQVGLLNIKGGEYTGSLDRLANFRRGAGLTGIQPLTCLFIYMSKHYDSFATFVKDRQTGNDQRPRSETMRSRLLDMANYCILAAALLQDEASPEPAVDREVPSLRR